MVTRPGLIPSSTTPLSDKSGRITNPWYFWLKSIAEEAGVDIGPFVNDGTADTYAPSTIYQGSASGQSTGDTGDIFFANDTRTISVNVAGLWRPMIPAMTGDVSNTAGSTTLTLATVNATPGIYTNATVTVDSKGRVIAVSNGSNIPAYAVGGEGAVQFSTVGGEFAGDASGLYFEYPVGDHPRLRMGVDELLQPEAPVIEFNTEIAANNGGVPVWTTLEARSGLNITGSEGLQFQTASTVWIELDEDGVLFLDGDPGVDGQLLSSTGPTTAPVWRDPIQIVVAFSFGDASPKNIHIMPGNKVIIETTIFITEAFNGTGAELTLGDAGDPDRFITATQVIPEAIGLYQTAPGYVYGSPTQITLTITPGSGASTGAGHVILTTQT